MFGDNRSQFVVNADLGPKCNNYVWVIEVASDDL